MSFLKLAGVFLGGLLISLQVQAQSCTSGHCGQLEKRNAAIQMCQQNADLIGISLDEFKRRGGSAWSEENGMTCKCPCSCVVGNTFIETNYGYLTIDKLASYHYLATPIAEEPLSRIRGLIASDSTDSKENVVRLEFDNGATIVSSPNHTFVDRDGLIVRAEDLTEGQEVLSASGEITTVKNDPIASLYNGRLYNVIVNRSSDLSEDHIININGLLSGDWYLQTANDVMEEELFARNSILTVYGTKNK